MFENFLKDLDGLKDLLDKKKSEIEASAATLSPEQKEQFKKFNEVYASLPDKENELKKVLNDLHNANSKMK